jgi:probable HAF family extracellular repeat protein
MVDRVSGAFAYGMNDMGQVVGASRINNGTYQNLAFITGRNGGGMTDVNSLVSLPGGAVLTNATGINNLGQIAANSATSIPEPETYAMLLAGLSLLGFIARRRKTAQAAFDAELQRADAPLSPVRLIVVSA